ncbi:transforming growth factor beta activator LRRC33 [Falco biarmicus]|uniref:transforming growth factor beta activator LRRC33 n=1 Tax=Falco cherrug TaxID=345164 RepID=UPI000392D954|nr:transforming growth factor beta activator LRRC33 [Falco cherrug]XP_027658139.1 transforming growth factor beta activator LRRC33 [Falco cherrug]XP_037262935.1 transforming growth factor beta activator LRRC33 [Falco rusticolus]XP_037262936.1 transforming growth factor beta activator LRRC33 [Falco rusticolus]XP_056214076.1 transforming growth factor beta activator LRRC33 [Falco biarmicus]XP_056214077.1 transforming growth factor beta activator LRRC33 [Falco biarmicus]
MEALLPGVSLLLVLLAAGWGSEAVTAWAPSPGGCELVWSTMDCTGRWLSSIPGNLRGDTEELLLDDNTIQVLGNASLLSYPQLWHLSLTRNRLELVEPGAFLSSQGLCVLSLADNLLFTNYSLTAAALSALPALRTLDLAGNRLTEDMVSVLVWNLSSLESLSVARNIIMRLDSSIFMNLTQLLELNLEKNYIFEIDQAFEGLQRLQRLNVAYNYLPCVVEFGLTQLRVLNVSNNVIEWFLALESDDFFELEVLDLSHNHLLFFPVLPRQSKLRSLLLKNNEMSFYQRLPNGTSLENVTVQFLLIDGNSTNVTTVSLWDEICHSNLSSLRLLDMSQNQVWYLPEGFLAQMPSLTHLKLNQNCLESFHLSEGDPLATLTELDLSQNRLEELGVEVGNGGNILPNLQLFNLSTNRLKALPPGVFTYTRKITTVDLSRNRVDLCPQPAVAGEVESPPCVDIRGVETLTHLSLASCGLRGLGGHPFQGTSLMHLDLSDNHQALSGDLGWLQDLTLTLQVLSLRNTTLSSTAVDFSAFNSLVHLDLSGNSLTVFPTSLGILKLRSLDLRDNCLPALPTDVVQTPLGKSLREVYLSRNPYNCCTLGWWDSLQHVKGLHVPDGQEVTCSYASRTLSPRALPEPVRWSCRWQTADLALLYLVLALPTCLTLLVAFALIFLTLKQKLLKMVKSRCGVSSPY